MEGYDGTGLPLNRNCQVYTAPAQKLEMAPHREVKQRKYLAQTRAGRIYDTYIYMASTTCLLRTYFVYQQRNQPKSTVCPARQDITTQPAR